MKASGEIVRIFPLKVISDKFSLREFVINDTAKPKYPQPLIMQASGEKALAALEDLREGDYVDVEFDVRGRKWVAWNADYWREAAQKAWTGSVGAPGSCSLPAGNHRDFAEQVCREQLAGKGEVGGAMVWTWNTLPGRHDFGDCMAMLFMGAAWQGIGTSGAAATPAPTKARVVISRPSARGRW